MSHVPETTGPNGFLHPGSAIGATENERVYQMDFISPSRPHAQTPSRCDSDTHMHRITAPLEQSRVLFRCNACRMTLKWPVKSPDLNPIEHLWRDLKTAVGRRHPSNLRHLEQLAIDEWSKIPVEGCKKLIDGYRLIFQLFFPKYEVQGANNFVQSIFGVLCGMIPDLAFFPQIFVFLSNANKKIYMNTKTFVIAAFFWEKWCII